MKNKQDALVALSVIACAGVLLGALVFSISGNPFKKPFLKFTADFDSVAGISSHSPVLYAGDRIGVVDSLEQLAPADRIDADAIVRLHLSITKDLALPANINISITSDSMLGEKYVAIQRIDDEGGLLQEGVHLLANSPQSMIESMVPGGTAIIEDIGSIAANLKSFTEKLDSGENGQNFSDSLANLKDLTADLKVILRGDGEDGEGLKTKLSDIADNLKTLSGDLKELVSGPEGNPEKGLKTRADGMLTNLEEFSEELKVALVGADGEPGLRVKVHNIADELNSLLAGTEDEAGMRAHLEAVMTRLSTVLLEVQAFIVWGEYVTGTLAEKPNRLIFGNRKNDVPTKEQILSYLRENNTPYPVVIKANDSIGNSATPIVIQPETTPTAPPVPSQSGSDDVPPPEPKEGFFKKLFQTK